MRNSTTVDVFCGAGGLTHGFILEGFNVVAGFDADETCRFPFEHNNRGAQFICKKIEDIDAREIVDAVPERWNQDTSRLRAVPTFFEVY